MPLDHEGNRRRYFSERLRADENADSPLRDSISTATRHRLYKEIESFTERVIINGASSSFTYLISEELEKIYAGSHPQRSLANVLLMPSSQGGDAEVFTALEVSAEIIWRLHHSYAPIQRLQSILKDDCSVWRFRNVGTEEMPEFQIQRIDPPHLHREIVDRAFELTRLTAFAAAQRDYADAWRHYSRGDFDDAVVNAGKAVESACKIVIKRVDSTQTPDNLQLGPLVTFLGQLDILPTRMQAVYSSLHAIFASSGSLRNAAGNAHGSLTLSGPEESVTLLALRLSGSLITFLAERHEQMKPPAPSIPSPGSPSVP